MKTTEIQLNDFSLRQVEDFVSAICYDNHLDNYHATMAVPVLKAVEFVIQSCSGKPDVPVVNLKSENNQKGIVFTISSQYSCFSIPSTDFFSDSSYDTIYLTRLLADEVDVVDDGRSIRMTFFVRGIDEREAQRRMSVLNHHYSPVTVEV